MKIKNISLQALNLSLRKGITVKGAEENHSPGIEHRRVGTPRTLGEGFLADTDRTVDVVQHIADRAHAQVSVHDNLDSSGRLVVMEFVSASLERQKAILPAEMGIEIGVESLPKICDPLKVNSFLVTINRWFVSASLNKTPNIISIIPRLSCCCLHPPHSQTLPADAPASFRTLVPDLDSLSLIFPSLLWGHMPLPFQNSISHSQG